MMAPTLQISTDPLASLERKLALVRDRVGAVARGSHTGLFLYGTGGIGKSYTVLSHLKALDAPYKLFNSRMTGKGLFRALERCPDVVFVLEDMERLTKDPDAQGVLRSALWAQPGHERIVTWTTATGGEERFAFRGGLILLSNRPLADLPELRALATRIVVLKLDVTDGEVEARMYELAARGYDRDGRRLLEPHQCAVVVAHLAAECRACAYPLDLRLLVGSYHDFIDCACDANACHWHDLVASRVREAASHFRAEPSKESPEDRKRGRRNALRTIMGQTVDVQEQVRLYKEQTGCERNDYFKRKREIQSGEFEGEQAA
jgi:hypothetical protein